MRQQFTQCGNTLFSADSLEADAGRIFLLKRCLRTQNLNELLLIFLFRGGQQAQGIRENNCEH